MLPFVILDSATTTVTLTSLLGVYIALGGTLAAALLAAFSSRNAAETAKEAAVLAAATAEKVADLSRQTTREVAELSAQVARESSTLAARTAQELKDKDYKNDFYKRLIERRLKAWEKSEELIGVLSATNTYHGNVMHAVFISGERFDSLLEMMRSMVMQAFWLGAKYSDCIKKFYDFLLNIRNQCMIPDKLLSNGMPMINDKLIREAGVRHENECEAYFREIILIASEQLRMLHDIEVYFDQLPKTHS